MSLALLISDNEVINNLYSVNLKAYVATNLTVKNSFDEAVKLIEVCSDLDIIICFTKIGEEETAKLLYDFIQNHTKKISMIFLGNYDSPPNDVIMVKSAFNIKAVIRGVAQILEISAKDMVDMPVPNFFPIPTKLLNNLDQASSDIYIRFSKTQFDHEYIKVIEKDTQLKDSLDKYLRNDISTLYVPSAERLRFINQTSALVIEQLEQEDLSTEDRIDITEQGLDLVTGEIFENKAVSKEVMRISNVCTKSIQVVIREAPRLTILLKSLLENKTKYLYLHSILASYISSEIIKNISWGSDEHAEKISFVLFYHDIFLSKIFDDHPQLEDEEDLIFNNELNEQEKDVVLNHARMAGELVSTFSRIPIGADVIIKQHHGTTNGMGVAVDYRDDISPLAKVVIVAEELTIKLLKVKMGKAKIFDKKATFQDLYKKFSRSSYRKIVEAIENIPL